MATEEKLPPEVEASYSAIIDEILQSSNLQTVSAKAIRKGLQSRVDYDITPQKKQITALIMTRFDKFSEQAAATGGGGDSSEPPEPPEPAPTARPPPTNGTTTVVKPTNGTTNAKKRPSPSASDEESELSSVATPPPKKKHKKSKSVELSDAALAARLQAEENGRTARATRGGNSTKRKTPVKSKKERKKKSKARVGSEDDSGAEGGEKKEVKRTGGFHKPLALSEPLMALLGEAQLSRPQTVKKIWEYIKANDLQDPSDKRQIICDDALRTVFKTEKVHMFTMNKILNQNLYAVDE